MKRALVGFIFIALTAFCAAQSSSKTAENPGQPTAAQTEEGSQQVVGASKQAAGKETAENENQQFKESASIQWMARALHISNSSAYWLAVAINFAVIAALVIFGIKKFVPGMMRSRTESIQKQIADAQKASEDASRRLSEIETRLAQLGPEIAAFQAEARAQSESEELRLRAAMEEERQRILAGAQQEISAAGASALRELKSYAAELAVRLAEKKIRLDAATDQALVRDFAEQLGKDGQ